MKIEKERIMIQCIVKIAEQKQIIRFALLAELDYCKPQQQTLHRSKMGFNAQNAEAQI